MLGRYGIKKLDDTCIAVFEEKVRIKKDTNEQYIDDAYVSYHRDVKGAVEGMLRKEINNNQARSPMELLKHIDNIACKVDALTEAICKSL